MAKKLLNFLDKVLISCFTGKQRFKNFLILQAIYIVPVPFEMVVLTLLEKQSSYIVGSLSLLLMVFCTCRSTFLFLKHRKLAKLKDTKVSS